jgi:uncharacterized metal-binding protein YceD (DUF177 family)
MTQSAPSKPTRFRTGGLSPRKPTHFAFAPDAAAREEMARTLGILAIPALKFSGSLTPTGRDELTLTGQLEATVKQACVVTLAPVTHRLDEPVRRRYVAGLAAPEAEEAEIPDDDSLEPMPETIDLVEVVSEALALALPLYPRAEGAELGEAVYAPDTVKPITDADLKPFAGLADLAATLRKKSSDEG